MSGKLGDIVVTQDEVIFLMEAGLIYRDAGKYQEAREVFRGVMALYPNSDIPYVAYGTTLFAEGNYEEAISNYQTALVKNPESAYAYAHLGEAFFMKKDFEAARDNLLRAVELDEEGPNGDMARSILEVVG